MNKPTCPQCGAATRLNSLSGIPVCCTKCAPEHAIHLRLIADEPHALCGAAGEPIVSSVMERVSCPVCCKMEGV